MSSEIKANKISPATGTAFTLGDSGDTFTVPSGGTLAVASGATITNSGTATGFGGDNTPAFLAKNGNSQTVTSDANTKIVFDEEVFDTDGAFDASTNYRFTVPSGEGGKYFFYFMGKAHGNGTEKVRKVEVYVKINGSDNRMIQANNNGGYHVNLMDMNVSCLLDLSASDYVEIWGLIDSSENSPYWESGSSTYTTQFGGFKLI